MANIHDIDVKVNKIIFTYFQNEDRIICDQGINNIKMENGINLQYEYNDSKDFGNRDHNEQSKLILLNEIMYILTNLQKISHKILNKDISDTDFHCQAYECGQNCSCMGWDNDDSMYLQEENYLTEKQIKELESKQDNNISMMMGDEMDDIQ